MKTVNALTLIVACSCTSLLHGGTVSAPSEKTVAAVPPPSASTFGGPLLERSKLTGDWGGLRDDLAAHGLTIDLNGIYTFQSVVDGGTALGDEDGNLFSGDLGITLDTGKAGLWPGGFLKFRFEGRGGDSVQKRVGGISPVNNDLIAPNVPGHLGETAWAVTELSYTQFLSEQFGVTFGLLNTTGGDSNPIAGSMISNDHFLNTAFLYSPVESATIPTVTLGGGLVFIPSKNLHGTFIVAGSTETAGNNPFDRYEGTSFSTEWTLTYDLGERPGGMTVGAIYSIDRPRADLNADARLFFGTVLLTGETLTTNDDAWSIYWNGYQYIQGDEKDGWGVFARLGFGDNEVNAVRFNMAVGVGGTSCLPGRKGDKWGLGFYYVDLADVQIIDVLGLGNEVGAEFFYNIALTPWAHMTLDAQLVDPPGPRADTAVVLGVRMAIAF